MDFLSPSVLVYHICTWRKQGWTHFTLFISFLLCCFKLCNHLHTINCDIWLLSTTTTSFLYWLISFLLLLKIFTLEFALCMHLAREVDDPGLRGTGLINRKHR